jgi:demethylmenaquinone methyltransferase/2-methoxy-6-polyprenyl-1,4-benzoquinol methylase
MFAAIARRYDLNNRLHSFGRDQAWRRKAVQLCDVRPTDDVLDVACGTGDLSECFAVAGARSVTGVDFTAEMLAIARVKSSRWIGGRRASPAARRRERKASPVMPHYVQGDAMELPFSNASFDIVSIAWGIRNIGDADTALLEFRRVLRPDGRLCILEFSEPRNPVMRWGYRVYCGHIMPWTATLIAGDRSGAYRYLPQSVSTFPPPPEFARHIERAGFAPPALHQLTFAVCTIFTARPA